jgi:hypothetical protein
MALFEDDLFKQFDGNNFRWEGWREQQNNAGRALGDRHPYLTRYGPWVFKILSGLGWLLFVCVGIPMLWDLFVAWLWPVIIIAGLSAIWGIVFFTVWRYLGWWFRSLGITSKVYTWICVSAVMLTLTLIGLLW